MKFLRMLAFAAVVAVLLVVAVAGTASGTTLTGSGGSTLGTGTELKAENEGTLVLDPPVGKIECKKSSLAGKTTNGGGEGVSVSANVETLTFNECNATVTVLAKGTLSIEGTGSNNGTLKGSSNEVTVEFVGTHCIFKTSSTTLGTITGSATTGGNATLDISATIPRTGGRSGAFCGSSAPWTGSYKFTTPSTLNIDSGGGGGGKTSTTIATSLSGESKTGEEITVNEGSKVKDTATLSGTNAGKATGTVKYKVYADKECKELVTNAGEVTVSEGKVPASEEKTLEAGRVYYWQAEYSGDSSNEASKSSCGKEVLTVKASTSLSTSLSGEAKTGEEITVNESSKVKDTATLSGTRSLSATGKVKFRAYKDKECKELASEAGEGSLSEGKASSEEKALEAGAVYYWQAEYAGDSLHQASTSTCGKEVLTVKAATSLATSLSGEAKSGEEITILEGSKAKDTATVSGTRSSTATGKAKYKVYADSECKELVSEAGEVTVTSGSVPASEEKTLEAGKTYYWQATYEGDSLHQASTSSCGKEVLKIKASTSLSTSLSGEAKTGEEITVNEGSKVKDTATLSGTRSSSATGKVKFKVYKDKECKELASEAGEGSLSEGKASSEEKALEAGAVYYWQAEYPGDSLHQASTSTCGNEVLTIKASTSLSTSLIGPGSETEEPPEGKEITVVAGASVVDKATLSGTNVATATGKVKYDVYADEECEELVEEAGEVEVEGEEVPVSAEVEVAEGDYYWQATYEGDALHQGVVSPCDEHVSTVAPISISTSLAGEGEEGEMIEVSEEAVVTDTATLTGPNAGEATGKVKYDVYADEECEELVEEVGEVEVSGKTAPASAGQRFEPGLYYWQAVYSGDGANQSAEGPCDELELVVPAITTELSGGEVSGENITVAEGTAVQDAATLHGPNAGEATGKVKYDVYADEKCEELAEEAGEVEVEGATAPASATVELEEGTYYWQAEYSGDVKNPPSRSPCGSEVLTVDAPTSLSTTLSGGEKEGEEIEVGVGAAVRDQATLSGPKASTAKGFVGYTVYKDSECEEFVEFAGKVEVNEGTAEPSSEVTLPPGTYYWQADYSGDGVNESVLSPCGSEKQVITAPITLTVSGESQSGSSIQIEEDEPVTGEVTLHGKYASEATGKVNYTIYADEECEEPVKEASEEAGEVEVTSGSVPSSGAVEIEEPGVYYWQADYTGDEKNPPATSSCGAVEAHVVNPDWIYAALGDSFSSGEGVREIFGLAGYYGPTRELFFIPGVHGINICHRSPQAWPALIAESAFGKPAIEGASVFNSPASPFIFRACSAAATWNVWSGGPNANFEGRWDEFRNPNAWVRTPAEVRWLPAFNPAGEGIPNQKIAHVSLTIGGNDSGFARIVLNCIEPPHFGQYSPAGCLQTINEERVAGLERIRQRLPTVLQKIRELAPNAVIDVFQYPQLLQMRRRGFDIPIEPFGWFQVNNTVVENNTTAAWEVSMFANELNQVVREAAGLPPPGAAAAVPNVHVFNSMVGALRGHMLGDPVPWVNGVVFPALMESLHPDFCGHRAMAAAAQRVIVGGNPPPIGKCL